MSPHLCPKPTHSILYAGRKAVWSCHSSMQHTEQHPIILRIKLKSSQWLSQSSSSWPHPLHHSHNHLGSYGVLSKYPAALLGLFQWVQKTSRNTLGTVTHVFFLESSKNAPAPGPLHLLFPLKQVIQEHCGDDCWEPRLGGCQLEMNGNTDGNNLCLRCPWIPTSYCSLGPSQIPYPEWHP